MVMADRTYRPGVSVSLSCHMFHPVAPGERSESRRALVLFFFCLCSFLDEQDDGKLFCCPLRKVTIFWARWGVCTVADAADHAG